MPEKVEISQYKGYRSKYQDSGIVDQNQQTLVVLKNLRDGETTDDNRNPKKEVLIVKD